MAHKKRKDYEVEEVEHDYWECDFCDREVESRSDVHVFAVEPEMGYDPSELSSNLVWLKKDEGESAVREATDITAKLEGHICDECLEDADLTTGASVRGTYRKIIDKLSLT